MINKSGILWIYLFHIWNKLFNFNMLVIEIHCCNFNSFSNLCKSDNFVLGTLCIFTINVIWKTLRYRLCTINDCIIDILVDKFSTSSTGCKNSQKCKSGIVFNFQIYGKAFNIWRNNFLSSSIKASRSNMCYYHRNIYNFVDMADIPRRFLIYGLYNIHVCIYRIFQLSFHRLNNYPHISRIFLHLSNNTSNDTLYIMPF